MLRKPSAAPPAKKEPAIPPKPSIKADLMSRREIIEMNKRPGASMDEQLNTFGTTQPLSVQTGHRTEEVTYTRPVIRSPRQQAQEDDGIDSPMSRQELLRVNREAFNASSGSAWYDRQDRAPPKVRNFSKSNDS